MFTVLHVEHNKFYHVVLQNLIGNRNIKYLSAKSPNDAFTILDTTKIDLVVTGLVFEGDSGMDFVNTLMSGRYPELQVIVLSSNDDEGLRKRLKEIGITEFVNKNTSMDRVKWYVDKLESKHQVNQRLNELKIAVLDENELELKLIGEIFAANNICNVEFFSDPMEFLIKMEHFSVFLINFSLPKISAEYLFGKIREKDDSSIIIAMSGASDEKEIAKIIDAGADDFVMKPVSERMLYDRLGYSFIGKDLRKKMGKASGRPTTDAMTGLHTNTYISEFLDEMMEKYRYNGDLSLVLFNIDGMKHVNRIYGPEFGDEVIARTARIIKDLVRSTDEVARSGGQEFLLVLPDTDLDGAVNLADKIRETIHQTNFGRTELIITISGGVSEMDSDDKNRMIERARVLLNKAKRNGKNRIEYDMLT